MSTSTSTARARSLHARLLALSTGDLAPPHVDPGVAALAALGLVDFARSPDGRKRFDELAALDGFDSARLDDLEMLANALMGVVESFDSAERTPQPLMVPQSLEIDCRARREKLSVLLEQKLGDVPAVARALKQLRLSYGPIDLAVDLRTLAALLERHAEAFLSVEGFTPDLPASTRALARKVEDVLHEADTPELEQARSALHRMWYLFEQAYRELAAVGRELFADHADAIFPSLESIAEIQRTARQQSSSKVPAAMLVERAIPPSRRAMSRRPSSHSMAAVRPPAEAAPLSLEVVLDATSESNLWLGFSQDMAEGGVFIATYETRPLGARIEISLRLHEDAEPIFLFGNVHWLRPPSAGDDFPVGVGVRLADVSTETARVLQKFAARRTPIFYDD